MGKKRQSQFPKEDGLPSSRELHALLLSYSRDGSVAARRLGRWLYVLHHLLSNLSPGFALGEGCRGSWLAGGRLENRDGSSGIPRDQKQKWETAKEGRGGAKGPWQGSELMASGEPL